MQNHVKNEKTKIKISGKWKEIVGVALLAFTILFAAWRLFYTSDDAQNVAVDTVYSDTEKRLSQLLSQMDGVGNADVVVCETEDGIQSVVVLE